jgi:hypothetical protein
VKHPPAAITDRHIPVKRLRAAWTHDAKGLQRHAHSLLDAEGPLPSRQAIARLLARAERSRDGGSITAAPDPSSQVSADDRASVEIQASGPDGVVVKVNAVLGAAECEHLRQQIEQFLLALCGGQLGSQATARRLDDGAALVSAHPRVLGLREAPVN